MLSSSTSIFKLVYLPHSKNADATKLVEFNIESKNMYLAACLAWWDVVA